MKVAIILSLFCALATGQRITTIQLDGIQYFVSRMNPYSPELNYFLAYQYCRSLGLQLASFETKEKVESMSQYLQNAGYSKYDFWTSGNRLGTGMFLWMSTGLPFNATFDYFHNANDAAKAGLLDPVDHNSNTTPQRTARDSNSGLEKGCVILQAPSLRWAPEDCSAVKDFICEQTRCYYYNYGSIPVSSAQGRPLIPTTPASSYSSDSYVYSSTTPASRSYTTISHVTTPVPSLHPAAKSISDRKLSVAVPLATLRVTMETSSSASNRNDDQQPQSTQQQQQKQQAPPAQQQQQQQQPQPDQSVPQSLNQANDDQKNVDEKAATTEDSTKVNDEETNDVEIASTPNESDDDIEDISEKIEETTSVEQRLKKISEEIEKFSNNDNADNHGRQSFFSLQDLIKTLHPTDKKIIPQIDSDYSNTMHVLGETASIVGGDDSRKIKTIDLRQTNRALY